MVTDELRDEYDVVVIGGGAAGLAGAVTLARARRSVVVLDAGEPRNAPAEGVHALLGREGIAPAELLEQGRAEVRQYGGSVVDARVTEVARGTDANGDDDFTVGLADGRSVRARRILVTTGLVDELPDIPGIRERWGNDVIHCPYCHGWEHRDQAIAVLASGPMAVHKALLLRQWSENTALLTHTIDGPDTEEAEQLAARDIRVVDGEVAGLDVVDGALRGVFLADGTRVACDVLVVAPRMVARAGLLAALGLQPIEHPSGMGEYIPADPMGRTESPGVWAAGNISDIMAQVGTAAAAGTFAAAALNADLVMADTRRAVAARAGVMA
ncbi:NAD(P)/FAD-dependent oxidoreductase [Aldersonia kunmingensis]|uniref:NAD(P)/FAD-dependent oxidoreductase n=1 Tax=Aldersonia kunmingensis TaxID=408066 RepID=UPI0009FE9545|nr:NAD(P)/FAD-dependent oxidoreductase [Aldersonia kunmingensis]